MKIVFLFTYLFLSLLNYNFLWAQEISLSENLYQEISSETLIPYFNALKNGDVRSIKSCLSEDMYKKYKVLLEQNKKYPEFLRNYYMDVEFIIEKIEASGADILVSASIKFPNNVRSYSKFLISKDLNERWKIKKKLID